MPVPLKSLVLALGILGGLRLSAHDRVHLCNLGEASAKITSLFMAPDHAAPVLVQDEGAHAVRSIRRTELLNPGQQITLHWTRLPRKDVIGWFNVSFTNQTGAGALKLTNAGSRKLPNLIATRMANPFLRHLQMNAVRLNGELHVFLYGLKDVPDRDSALPPLARLEDRALPAPWVERATLDPVLAGMD